MRWIAHAILTKMAHSCEPAVRPSSVLLGQVDNASCALIAFTCQPPPKSLQGHQHYVAVMCVVTKFSRGEADGFNHFFDDGVVVVVVGYPDY